MSRGSHAAVPHVAPRQTRAISGRETALVFVVSAAVAFPRTGPDAFRGVMWAEDGAVVLQRAYEGHGWGALLTAYQGYAIALPRLVGSLISYLPVTLHGLAVCGAAVAIQAALAVFAFHVASSHTRGRLAGWIVVLGVAALPVGPEVAGNLVNLQWFLLFAACVAPFWEPPTRAGRVAAIAVVCAMSLSGPFGVIPLVVTAIVWFFRRRRDLMVLLIASGVSTGVQLITMATAPPRQIPVTPQLNPIAIMDSYVRRVMGDGILGLGRYPDGATSSSIVAGLVVGLGIAILAGLTMRERGRSAVVEPVVAVVLSVVTYAAPVGLSGATGAMPPMYSGRYAVGPTLLLVFAVALLIGRITVPRSSAAPGSAPSFVLARVLAAGLAAAIAYGAATSWSQPQVLRRDEPSWSSEVARGRLACEQQRDLPAVSLQIAPAGWFVAVPCARLAR